MMLRSKFNSLVFAILLLLVFGPGLITAQKNKKEASVPTLPDVIKSNLMIQDAAGKQVDNIDRSDIKIFENGVEQKITYFSKKDPGLSLAFVVDNSGSMQKKLKRQIFIGKSIVANLTDSDESMLIRFVDSGKITTEQTWTRKKEPVIKAFNKLFVEGGQSAVTDALYLAVQLMVERERQAKNERKAIILITDAEDRDNYYKLNDVANLLRNSDVQIFVLALTNDLGKNSKTNAENFARQIAVESSGIAYIFGTAITDENIQEVLKSIMVELRSPYIVGYSPIDRNPEMPRKLAISVTDGQQGEKRNAVASENKILLID